MVDLNSQYMNALTSGGQASAQAFQAGSSMFNSGIEHIMKGASLALKIDALLQQEEAQKNQEVIQAGNALNNIFNTINTDNFRNKQLDIQKQQMLNTEEYQNRMASVAEENAKTSRINANSTRMNAETARINAELNRKKFSVSKENIAYKLSQLIPKVKDIKQKELVHNLFTKATEDPDFGEKYANGVSIGGKNYSLDEAQEIAQDYEQNKEKYNKILDEFATYKTDYELLYAGDGKNSSGSTTLTKTINVNKQKTVTQWSEAKDPVEAFKVSMDNGITADQIIKDNNMLATYATKFGYTIPQAKAKLNSLDYEYKAAKLYAQKDTEGALLYSVISHSYDPEFVPSSANKFVGSIVAIDQVLAKQPLDQQIKFLTVIGKKVNQLSNNKNIDFKDRELLKNTLKGINIEKYTIKLNKDLNTGNTQIVKEDLQNSNIPTENKIDAIITIANNSSMTLPKTQELFSTALEGTNINIVSLTKSSIKTMSGNYNKVTQTLAHLGSYVNDFFAIGKLKGSDFKGTSAESLISLSKLDPKLYFKNFMNVSKRILSAKSDNKNILFGSGGLLHNVDYQMLFKAQKNVNNDTQNIFFSHNNRADKVIYEILTDNIGIDKNKAVNLTYKVKMSIAKWYKYKKTDPNYKLPLNKYLAKNINIDSYVPAKQKIMLTTRFGVPLEGNNKYTKYFSNKISSKFIGSLGLLKPNMEDELRRSFVEAYVMAAMAKATKLTANEQTGGQ